MWRVLLHPNVRFRIGDYRALIDLDVEQRIVKVQVLDHRRRIYKR